MKKVTATLLMLTAALFAFSACGQNTEESTTEFADPVMIMVNTKGMGGNIEISEDGSDPKPDPEYPMQSAYSTVERGTVVKILAEPEEGYHFYKWTVDGEEYSTEPLITVTAEVSSMLLSRTAIHIAPSAMFPKISPRLFSLLTLTTPIRMKSRMSCLRLSPLR